MIYETRQEADAERAKTRPTWYCPIMRNKCYARECPVYIAPFVEDVPQSGYEVRGNQCKIFHVLVDEVLNSYKPTTNIETPPAMVTPMMFVSEEGEPDA